MGLVSVIGTQIPSFMSLSLSIFAKAYLDILPHFDLFRHFFYLKARGGSGSRIVGSAYLQLRDGMVGQYIATLLNTNVKYWA